MAIINLDLSGSGTTVIDENNASDGDTLAVTALGSHTLIVDNVTVEIDSITGVTAASNPTFQAQNGGNLTIDQGLLNIAALNSLTFNIVDDGMITLDGSTLDLLSGVTNLLNTYTVDFSGSDVGTFVYDPPAVSILGSINFDVNGMQAGDTLDLGGQDWDSGVYDAVNDQLTLTSSVLLGQTVTMTVEMSETDFLVYQADPSAYLSGDTFIYPGAIVCFRAETRVLTIRGYVKVENLRAGMLVQTLEGSFSPIIWVGSTNLDATSLSQLPNMWPIRIQRDALGTGFPKNDIEVSPQHRLYVNGKALQETCASADGLIAAKHLTTIKGIDVVPHPEAVAYYHVLLPTHEIIWAENLPAESLYLGQEAGRAVDHRIRNQIASEFPDGTDVLVKTSETRHQLLPGRVARKIASEFGSSRTHFFAPGKIRHIQRKSHHDDDIRCSEFHSKRLAA
ncbi:Hint domain-containing protein [Pseudooceanicola atlanticus]|uniref:Hint domain-containing protein n=1 Tax=Pseudooceanicola atlanticus TaxID=1461694 RepID=UPI0023569F45|nr:Hint domain-containing protein [Pseudooceanicola atlanticus]